MSDSYALGGLGDDVGFSAQEALSCFVSSPKHGKAVKIRKH